MTEDKNTDGTIVQYLLGGHSYNGKWFMDEEHPGTPRFWWRPILREYLEQQSPIPSTQTTNEQTTNENKIWEEVQEIIRLSFGIDFYRSNKIADYLKSKYSITKKVNNQ